MATAGGAKMEPASCVKQSPSQNALRCLRFVPPWERHSAERAGWQVRQERDVTSARCPAPRSPEVPGMSSISSDKSLPSLRGASCAGYSQVAQVSHLKRLLTELPASKQRCFLSLRGTPDSVLEIGDLFRTSLGQSLCSHHFLL